MTPEAKPGSNMAVRQLPTPTRDRDRAVRDMAEHGYSLIADALSHSQVEAMRDRLIEQSLAEGKLRGEERSMDDEHLRFDTGALLNKGSVFLELLDPNALAWQVVGDVLEPSVDPRNAAKWNLEQRFLLGALDGMLKRLEVDTSGERSKMAHLNPIFHIDQGMVPWWTQDPLVVNTFFFLTDYTEENGATLVVPGTHLRPTPDWSDYSGDDAVAVEGPAGTALLVDGRCWHAAGINTNGELRATVLGYCASPWVRQRWSMAMNLRQDVVDQMTDAQLRMCGFDTLFQSAYGAIAGPGIIEPTLGRNNVTVKQKAQGELHLT
jgi:ectoine hydroxylase-related dioxygenase (phytanoyl-CoA dioxygenase family)